MTRAFQTAYKGTTHYPGTLCGKTEVTPKEAAVEGSDIPNSPLDVFAALSNNRVLWFLRVIELLY